MVAEAPDGGARIDGRVGVDGARDDEPDDRLGHHLAVHPSPRPGRDGCAGRAGGGRPGAFIVGFGTSKIFLNNTKQGGPPKVTKPLAHMRDSVEIVRGILGGERFEYDGKVFSADIPALSDEAHAPNWSVPVYVAGTAPMMQQIGGEIGDGLLTPSITTPDYVRYTAGNIREGAAKSGRPAEDVDLGCTISPRSMPPTATPGATVPARSVACTSPTRSRTSRGRPTCCSSRPGSSRRRSFPSQRRWRAVAAWPPRRRSPMPCSTSASRSPVRPSDCIEAIEEYRDAGCTHIMLELWGENRLEQIRLFGEKVLPHFRD